jgi:tetratricopeptide (TPR) repeat protein
LKITGPQWKQLFGLLDTVLDLPPAQRPTLLARVAGEDPELGDKLRQLLEENVDWDAAIPRAASILGGMHASALRAGTQVGPYTLIRELGEGGMSTVWLAARSDGQVRRPLALKLPHVFMRTARLAERFEREREILESLSHPNIARLYDAGVTVDGQPYLGMEYVEGVSLVARRARVRAWASLPKSVDLANSVHLVNALSGMAMISIDAAKFGSAKSAAAEALVLADSLGAIANGERRQVFEALGYANWGLGDPAAAEENLRRAAQIAAAGTADVVLDKLETSGPLADFLLDTGRVGEGLAILQNELPDVESLRGARAASIRPARTWLRYGRALVMYGRLEEGMAILQNALDRQPDFIPTAEFTAELLDAKASGSMDMGRYAEAERLIADAADAHKQIGEFFTIYENPNVTLRTRRLMDMGRIDEASTAFRAYVTGAPDAGELSRPRIEPIIVRAELSLAQGAAAAAKDLAGQVLNLVARSNGRKYLTGWEMQASLVSGKADLLAGRPNEALPLLARALELGREHYDPGRSPRYADTQIAMAECMLDLGRSVEGRELFAKAAANHATHTELAERYREPLRRLRARIAVSPRRLQ